MSDLLAELKRLDAALTPGPLFVTVVGKREYAWLREPDGRG